LSYIILYAWCLMYAFNITIWSCLSCHLCTYFLLSVCQNENSRAAGKPLPYYIRTQNIVAFKHTNWRSDWVNEWVNSFFIGYFIYLHFKWFSLSWFPPWKPPILSPHPPASMRTFPQPPIPTSLPWNSPILEHRTFPGPRASSLIDVRQSHPLLPMRLEPRVAPCVLFGWWFSS
jgi:hypothetical protein